MLETFNLFKDFLDLSPASMAVHIHFKNTSLWREMKRKEAKKLTSQEFKTKR